MGTPTLFMICSICGAPAHEWTIRDVAGVVYSVGWLCNICATVKGYNKMNLPQLSLDFLQNSFQVKPASKTFKTTPRDGISLEDCFKDANKWLRNQSEYTRVEFPYDGYYYVVAKLSEAK